MRINCISPGQIDLGVEVKAVRPLSAFYPSWLDDSKSKADPEHPPQPSDSQEVCASNIGVILRQAGDRRTFRRRIWTASDSAVPVCHKKWAKRPGFSPAVSVAISLEQT